MAAPTRLTSEVPKNTSLPISPTTSAPAAATVVSSHSPSSTTRFSSSPVHDSNPIQIEQREGGDENHYTNAANRVATPIGPKDPISLLTFPLDVSIATAKIHEEQMAAMLQQEQQQHQRDDQQKNEDDATDAYNSATNTSAAAAVAMTKREEALLQAKQAEEKINSRQRAAQEDRLNRQKQENAALEEKRAKELLHKAKIEERVSRQKQATANALLAKAKKEEENAAAAAEVALKIKQEELAAANATAVALKLKLDEEDRLSRQKQEEASAIVMKIKQDEANALKLKLEEDARLNQQRQEAAAAAFKIKQQQQRQQDEVDRLNRQKQDEAAALKHKHDEEERLNLQRKQRDDYALKVKQQQDLKLKQEESQRASSSGQGTVPPTPKNEDVAIIVADRLRLQKQDEITHATVEAASKLKKYEEDLLLLKQREELLALKEARLREQETSDRLKLEKEIRDDVERKLRQEHNDRIRIDQRKAEEDKQRILIEEQQRRRLEKERSDEAARKQQAEESFAKQKLHLHEMERRIEDERISKLQQQQQHQSVPSQTSSHSSSYSPSSVSITKSTAQHSSVPLAPGTTSISPDVSVSGGNSLNAKYTNQAELDLKQAERRRRSIKQHQQSSIQHEQQPPGSPSATAVPSSPSYQAPAKIDLPPDHHASSATAFIPGNIPGYISGSGIGTGDGDEDIDADQRQSQSVKHSAVGGLGASQTMEQDYREFLRRKHLADKDEEDYREFQRQRQSQYRIPLKQAEQPYPPHTKDHPNSSKQQQQTLPTASSSASSHPKATEKSSPPSCTTTNNDAINKMCPELVALAQKRLSEAIKAKDLARQLTEMYNFLVANEHAFDPSEIEHFAKMSTLQREKALEASNRLTKISDVVKLAEVRSRFFDQFSTTFAQHSKLAVFFVDSNKDINHFIEQEINDRVIVAPPEVVQEQHEEEFDEELDTSNMKSSYSVQPHPSLMMYQQVHTEGRGDEEPYDHDCDGNAGDAHRSNNMSPQYHHRRRGNRHSRHRHHSSFRS